MKRLTERNVHTLKGKLFMRMTSTAAGSSLILFSPLHNIQFHRNIDDDDRRARRLSVITTTACMDGCMTQRHIALMREKLLLRSVDLK